MSDIADQIDRRRNAGAPLDAELVGLAERIAERSAVLTLDAAIEAARSVEHGASAVREAAQLKELAGCSLEALEDIIARTPR